MKLLKILTAFIVLVALQIAAAQWLNVPPPVEARGLMMVGGGVPITGVTCTSGALLFESVATADSLWNISAAAAGSSFTATENFYLHSIQVSQSSDDDGENTLRWGTSANLSTYIGTANAATALNGGNKVYYEYLFQDTTHQLTTAVGTYYFGLVTVSGTAQKFERNTAAGYAGGMYWSDTGWDMSANSSEANDVRFKVYKCQ